MLIRSHLHHPQYSPRSALIACVVGAALAVAPVAANASHPRAATARTLSVNDTAKLRLVGGSGNLLIEQGTVTGTLPGSAKVTLDINSASATSTFTLYLRGGTIVGRGIAKLHPSRSGRYDSFGGTASITHGSGRYAHISGTGGFYGVLDRSNYAAEVQVIGKLRI